MNAIPSEFLTDTLSEFAKYRDLGSRAMAQLSDDQLFHTPDSESNSIALIVKHLRGNMLSRWTDFLDSDGEKPDRQRDQEFEPAAGTSRSEVERWWEEGWAAAIAAIEALRPTDLGRVVTIRGEPLSVLQAILRNLCHAAYHVGQIVYVAKHLRGAEWTSLSIPRKR